MERWWEKVSVGEPDACWPWLGACDPVWGYGFFRLDKKGMSRASRAGWELLNGRQLREDELVCHRCDNPPCCNPSHWFIGTHGENQADKADKGRARCAPRYGESSPSAKLTSEQVRLIRQRYAEGGVLQRELAAEYGVGQTQVSRIIRGVRRPRG